MVKISIFLFLIFHFFSGSLLATPVLLDKVAIVTNDKIYTLTELSEFKRIYKGISELAPLVFQENKNNLKDIAHSLVRSFIIERELLDLGYNFSDEVINERINAIKNAHGISQDQLVNFLEGKSITYDRYFDLIKKSLQYSQFSHKVIGPIVAITDQEIKDYFEKRTGKSPHNAEYDLVLISLPKNYKPESHTNEWLKEQIIRITDGKPMDHSLRGISSTPLENVSADSLNPLIKDVVGKLTPGDISSPFKIKNQWQIVLLKNRKDGDSSLFKNNKEQVRQELFLVKSQGVIEKWLEAKKSNYFVQVNL